MKYTVRLIIAALAASAALVSCTKDLNPGKSDTDQTAGALRTINVSFDTPTKSYLDGNQPCFSKGDSVLVSDGTALDTCAVDVDGKKTIIRTKLEGETLSAVYPYTAATVYNGVKLEVKIPAIQTGKFADANICMANQYEQVVKDNLIFRNRVAILKFYADESIGVDTIRVSCTEGTIASGSDTIIVTAPKVEKSQLSNPTQDPRIWYVAMNNVKDATSLTFESVTKTQGTVTKKPKMADDGQNDISAGYIYNAFIPYYIEVKVNDTPETYQKWAYCNVGAFLPEEPGEYFMWGEVKGHKAKGTGSGAFDFTGFAPFGEDRDRYKKATPEKGFHQDNAPYYEPSEGGKFTKYGSGELTTLELRDDAANANWGGNWRMPEENELGALITGGALSDGDFLRPVGSGENLELKSAPTYYWSRNNHDKSADFATALDISNSPATTTAVERWKGCPIRPIVDETLSGDQPATVTISAYTSGGTL